ncbi:hypothetical protein BGX26_000577 [Mortierella sp. AD094]|nr:hypothetical protein BGX26_000577 [Mortierella sp. AD094]
MTVVGNDLYILCTVDSTSTIYHHDGNNWTTPIVMPCVPWVAGQGRFFRSSGGQLWAFIRSMGDMFTVSVNGNSANWTRAVDAVNIPQTFGNYTGSTPSPQPNNGGSSSEGISGGAIAGIIVGAIAVIVAAVFVIKARKKRGHGKNIS